MAAAVGACPAGGEARPPERVAALSGPRLRAVGPLAVRALLPLLVLLRLLARLLLVLLLPLLLLTL